MATVDCQGFGETQAWPPEIPPRVLLSAHMERNKSKDEPRDSEDKVPLDTLDSQVYYYLWRADSSFGNRAVKTTQAGLAPEAPNSMETNSSDAGDPG